jgi:hypothetical protein
VNLVRIFLVTLGMLGLFWLFFQSLEEERKRKHDYSEEQTMLLMQNGDSIGKPRNRGASKDIFVNFKDFIMDNFKVNNLPVNMQSQFAHTSSKGDLEAMSNADMSDFLASFIEH